MNGEHLLTAAGGYIDELHATLWGRSWDLSQPEQRRDAATWLASQVWNVLDHLEQGE